MSTKPVPVKRVIWDIAICAISVLVLAGLLFGYVEWLDYLSTHGWAMSGKGFSTAVGVDLPSDWDYIYIRSFPVRSDDMLLKAKVSQGSIGKILDRFPRNIKWERFEDYAEPKEKDDPANYDLASYYERLRLHVIHEFVLRFQYRAPTMSPKHIDKFAYAEMERHDGERAFQVMILITRESKNSFSVYMIRRRD